MAGIYVHVPFCKQKCTYCDFASFPKALGKAEAYFACLFREIKGKSIGVNDRLFNTIYFGGGTPSIVPTEYVGGALKQIRDNFNLIKDPEITIELNPGTVNKNKVNDYIAFGINRFSIGLQTADEQELKRLNRIHTAQDFIDTCNLLKGQNISADVLIGLHDQTEKQLLDTLKLAVDCGVDHVSMYALTPEVGTPIYSDYLNGLLPSDDEVADLYEAGVKFLQENGIERYEVSNFAKPGYESKHNMNYWKRGEYLGFGVAASSFWKERRFTNTFDIDEYMNAIISNKTPEVSSDLIEGDDRKNEFIMLALRTTSGVDKKRFKEEFSSDFDKEYGKPLSKMSSYLINDKDTLRIKDEYLFVQNEIIINFFK